MHCSHSNFSCTANALGSFQDSGLEEESKEPPSVRSSERLLSGSSTNGNMVYMTALWDFEKNEAKVTPLKS